MSEEQPDPGETLPRGPSLPRAFRSPLVQVGLLIAATALLLYVLSSWRYFQLETGTWDLGIYQQALYSTAHGHPFYEAADLETGGFGSFLQVHSALLLFALVPVYSATPSPLTLLAVQSAVVASAAAPLYLLARDVTTSHAKSLAVVLLYLLGVATVSSTLFDFHVEAFIPLEYFAFVLFFQRERYLAAGGVAFLGFVTMESLPWLVVAVGLFYGLPPFWSLLVRFRDSLRTAEGRRGAVPDSLVPSHRLVACAVLVVVCVGAYYLLLALREDWIATWLGTSPFPQSAVSAGYIIGGSPTALGLSVGNLGAAFFQKATYWLLLFAVVGFVPLLAPRTLLLSLPWFAFTFLSGDTNLTEIGFQYGFLAGPPLLVSFLYGARRLDRDLLDRLFGALPAPKESAKGLPPAAVPGRRTGRTAVVAVGILVGFNLLMSPLNPALQSSPNLGAAYRLSYSTPSGFTDVERIAGLVPPGSTVVASDNLFPFVANSLAAYSFLWGPDPTLGLPFNATVPPDFVFLAENRLSAVPPWLTGLLYQPSVYAVRGSVFASPAGSVLLFERGYSGPSVDLGGPPIGPIAIDPQQIDLGPFSTRQTDPASPMGTIIQSDPGTEGLVWQGPYGSVPAGNYTVTIFLRAWATQTAASQNLSAPVLSLNANAFGQALWFTTTVSFGSISGGGYVSVELPLAVPELSVGVVFRGYALNPAYGLGFAGIVLTPHPT